MSTSPIKHSKDEKLRSIVFAINNRMDAFRKKHETVISTIQEIRGMQAVTFSGDKD